MLRLIFLLILFFCYFLSGCGVKKNFTGKPVLPLGTYSTKSYSTEVSAELQEVTKLVKKVYCVSTYTTFQFRREAKISARQLTMENYKKAAWGIVSKNETSFGTATVIAHTGSRIALLTCSHIMNAPDTLISWYETTPDDPALYIQSISIREKQEIWVKDLSPCGPFNVLAFDNLKDIAILGKNCELLTDTVSSFPFVTGHAKKLGWGCFVYMFGYPLGNQVVTNGIVSLLPNRPLGEFSVDGLLNKGFSGGIVIALRIDQQGFELVGMIKTVTASREDFLKPDPERDGTLDWLPYKGTIFIGKSDIIQYGLNSVVPVEAIIEFYHQNRQILINSGYNLDGFFQGSF